MGLILPQTVKVRVSKNMCKYYRKKGYKFERSGDIIEVNVLDLPKGSATKVKIICDICGKEKEICYGDVVKNNEENKLITCASISCMNKKCENTCMKKYKVKYALQSKEIRDKGIQTLKEKYGEDITNVFQATEVKEKIKNTNEERYGHACTLRNEEIQKKAFKTLRSNGNTIHCSRQQTYLANLLNGEVNVPLTGYWADIILKDKKIDLEYDGGGHTLCITRNQCTEEQFNQKEREREIKIYERGYKTIRIISKKDKLPSDEVILNLIKKFANFDFKVIRIDIDEGTINIDYKEKLNYEFGELREITDKDLK